MENPMNSLHASLFALLLGASAPVMTTFARAPSTLVESSVEATAADLSLPRDDSGIITVRACQSCGVQTFYFAQPHELILAGRHVELKQMIEALRLASSAAVTVHFRNSDQKVTRIVIKQLTTPDAAQ
jgi:hypothetical protein